MHRDLQITVVPAATDRLLDELTQMDGVITLVDAVLRAVQASEAFGALSIATSSLDSLTDTTEQLRVRADVDEAIWEEAETAMRRHTHPTASFYLTTAAGGLIALCALVSSSVVTQAVALVAAGIIAPAFEPLVRIVLAATNRHANIMRQALSSTLLSFGVLIAISAVTMLVLRAGSPAFVADFVHNQTVRGVQHPAAINLMISAGGAVAGVVMVAWPSTSPWCSSRPPATSPISTSPLTVADASRGDHAPGGGSHERSFCLALM